MHTTLKGSEMSRTKKFHAVLAATMLLAAIIIPSQSAAAIAPDQAPSCGVLAPRKADQTERDQYLAQLTLNDYCASLTRVSPLTVGYGKYLRLAVVAPLKTCTCGPSYRAWSIDTNATGVPYDGKPAHLNSMTLIWRVGTSGAWQYTNALPVDTYNTIPTQSGTMSSTSRIYAEANVYNYLNKSIDRVITSAP